ncbi:diguanylate cyclase domain-containing protein [Dorea formicigenerans]|mgnify:FL=1|uniref:Stage 0 sporulation protein A homolog n=1 Tax=Dorea formicigenerans TaxID=39486 RepID=A0A415N6H4_9FIRM|nr:diguanylate cyclase [Dorea formicigenerans]RGK34637.1 diguanylate cyclase [Dorea formicigenerans]RHK62340.1 diguanylate cyclase [Dorea formicigenerans]RHL90993.1 diguanylate cyclase [Dorea formicigenerans]
MSSDYIMTMQQAQMEMELYKKVFTVVRLLDKREFRLEENDNPGGDMELCHCYDFWKKEKPCTNCIAARAFEEKSVRTKLEYPDSDIYQVTARYVEIDGQPYVMELLRKMDEEFLVDLENRDRLMEKLSGYNEKLYQDALTGVYNRRYYEDRIKKMTASVGVAMIDMDDFKIYNDTYGHNAGDLALITTVEAIRRCIRKNDTLIRYGGDEFLLVLQGISETMFREKLKQIRTEIYNANVPTYSRLQLSASIGGVMSAGRTVEETVMEADKFMYLAKNRKNTVVTEKDFANEEGEDGTALEALKVKQQILIVDDSEMNREILTEMLQDDFRILEAENGEEALKMLKQYDTGISLMLLDIVMPVMNGFEVLAAMAREHWMDDIPVIMISSEGSEDYIRRAYEMGIADYIRRPFDAKIVYQRVFNTIKLYAKQRRLISLVADQIYEKEKNNRMMVGILSQIVEFRNGESGPHVLHIQTLTRLLLERLVQKTGQYGLSWSEQYMISMASALHDIGKIGIDEKILNKSGKLTKEEFDIMKTHTLIGATMLENLKMYQGEILLEVAYQICRWHHERYDGKGYPDGLVGEKIPISAQVVSLADAYDALISDRVYKKAYSHEQAVKMILNGECGAFNPVLLECLTDIQDHLKEVVNSDFVENFDAEDNIELAGSHRSETENISVGGKSLKHLMEDI